MGSKQIWILGSRDLPIARSSSCQLFPGINDVDKITFLFLLAAEVNRVNFNWFLKIYWIGTLSGGRERGGVGVEWVVEIKAPSHVEGRALDFSVEERECLPLGNLSGGALEFPNPNPRSPRMLHSF